MTNQPKVKGSNDSIPLGPGTVNGGKASGEAKPSSNLWDWNLSEPGWQNWTVPHTHTLQQLREDDIFTCQLGSWNLQPSPTQEAHDLGSHFTKELHRTHLLFSDRDYWAKWKSNPSDCSTELHRSPRPNPLTLHGPRSRTRLRSHPKAPTISSPSVPRWRNPRCGTGAALPELRRHSRRRQEHPACRSPEKGAML